MQGLSYSISLLFSVRVRMADERRF